MITAKDISDALNGKQQGYKFRCDCPVLAHRSAKMMVTDRDDGSIGVHCFAGCEFTDIVQELERMGLWPKKELTETDKAEFKKKKFEEQKIKDRVWMAVYKGNLTIRTEADDQKYKNLERKYK